VLEKILHPFPRRAREGLARMLGADKVLGEADSAARAGYEERAAHSEPGLEPEATKGKATEAEEESPIAR
jgi:hypothetical protein